MTFRVWLARLAGDIYIITSLVFAAGRLAGWPAGRQLAGRPVGRQLAGFGMDEVRVGGDVDGGGAHVVVEDFGEFGFGESRFEIRDESQPVIDGSYDKMVVLVVGVGEVEGSVMGCNVGGHVDYYNFFRKPHTTASRRHFAVFLAIGRVDGQESGTQATLRLFRAVARSGGLNSAAAGLLGGLAALVRQGVGPNSDARGERRTLFRAPRVLHLWG